MAKTRIVVADRNVITRVGLRSILERNTGMAVVAEATSYEAALDAVDEHGPEAHIALQFTPPDAGPEQVWPFTEGVMATTVKFSRLLLGSNALIGRITMRHARHANGDQVEAYFQAPIEWDAPLDAIWFDRALLDQPLRGAFPKMGSGIITADGQYLKDPEAANTKKAEFLLQQAKAKPT